MRAKQLLLGVLLATLVLSGITATAFSWMEVGEGAAAGAVTGAIIGTAVPGIGTLIGAGVGALGGAMAAVVTQLLSAAPSTSSSSTNWLAYQENVYKQLYQESVAVADNEINIVNVMEETSTVYTVTAQKYEQVNFNANVSPYNPRAFYALLVGTGFLGTVMQEIGAPQELWIELQSQINQFNNLITPHTGDVICYNVNPNATVYYPASESLSGEFLFIVQGTVNVTGLNIALLCVDGQKTNQSVQSYTMTSGYYLVQMTDGQIRMNPNDGVALVFTISNDNGYLEMDPCPIGFNEPSGIKLQSSNGLQTILSNNLPVPNVTPIYVAEEIAIEMQAAAFSEYETLKLLGYENVTQLPPNFQLPTINLNVPLNFTNVSSLQEYNLLMSEYVQYLLAINKTLALLQQEGRLEGLKNITFNFTNPIQYFGEQGGFVFTGYIKTPYGLLPNGTYLIQPYGGPLTLTSTGGMIPSGGAIAYTLLKTPDGYALGNYSILPPGSYVIGSVQNPGTLYPVTQPQNISNIPTETYSQITTSTSSSSSSSALSNVVQYLESHPLVLIVTAFFGLIIIVALIRALL